MRLILLFLIAAPMLCHAIGSEECHLAGKINNKNIQLHALSNVAYGSKQHLEYGYCLLGRVDQSNDSTQTPNLLYYLSCTRREGEKQQIYYETTNMDPESAYYCKSGCAKKIVKKFKLLCAGD